jgi:hypothetical protein
MEAEAWRQRHGGRGMKGQRQRQCAAVERRAAGLLGERWRQHDVSGTGVFGMPSGQVGPLVAQLDSFPPLVPVVMGAFVA